jgi:hypothetical protein
MAWGWLCRRGIRPSLLSQLRTSFVAQQSTFDMSMLMQNPLVMSA